MSPSDLIGVLKSRGLPIATPQETQQAYEAFRTIGYYRLTGYMLPFQTTNGWKKHQFLPGASLEKILALYRLDSAIRSLSSEALGQIEVAMRTSISDHLCRKLGPHWPLKSAAFKPGRHTDSVEALAKAADFDTSTQKRKQATHMHDFIGSYYAKYTDPAMPPGWMIAECATFRTWAFIYDDLEVALQKEISSFWTYPSGKRIDHQVLQNWFHSLSVFRNRCAHQARITGRKFPFAPLPASDATVNHLFFPVLDDLRSLLAVTAILLKSVDPKNQWLARVQQAIQSEPLVHIQTAAGFTDTTVSPWRNDPLWGF